MFLKKFKPILPSLRFKIIINKKILWLYKSIKKLTLGLKKTSGRNNQGLITSKHKGKGNKHLYRIIDFYRYIYNISAKIIRIEYDPNRSGFISLILYKTGIFSYILAPNNIKYNDNIISYNINNQYIKKNIGNTYFFFFLAIGSLIHNIEIKKNKGGQFIRAAGTYGKLLGKNKKGYAIIKLKSGENRKINLNCKATIGTISNINHKNTCLGKAGINRWLNKKPIVRGVAMNPIDHPHGGNTPKGRLTVSQWGKLTKGKKTRKKKNITNIYIL
jgi:large subunit ribosomal protein L2